MKKIIFSRIKETRLTRADQIIELETGYCFYIMNGYPFIIVIKLMYYNSEDNSIIMSEDNIIESVGFGYYDDDKIIKHVIKRLLEIYEDTLAYDTAFINMCRLASEKGN